MKIILKIIVFNNQIYQQLKGISVGSPTAGIIAKWKLFIIETMIFEKLGDRFDVTWLHYNNEVFAINNIEDNPSIILNELNEINQSIQFTIECEHDNKLNYLDVAIIKGNQHFDLFYMVAGASIP